MLDLAGPEPHSGTGPEAQGRGGGTAAPNADFAASAQGWLHICHAHTLALCQRKEGGREGEWEGGRERGRREGRKRRGEKTDSRDPNSMLIMETALAQECGATWY